MGSLAKQMLKKRARVAKKKTKTDLREVCRTPLFTLTLEDGTPLTRTQDKGDERVAVTWCFTTHEKATAQCEALAEEYTEPLKVTRDTTGSFLCSLLTHLAHTDVDFLLLDEQELPLTTIGVRLLDGEKWTSLLNQSRSYEGANLQLAQVVIDVLQAATPESAVVVETASYAELVQAIMGKHGSLPDVDLGIVWMFAASVAEGVEPVYLQVNQVEESDDQLTVGPLFFSNYQAATSWPRVLPQNIAENLANMKLHLIPYRGMGLLEEVNENFPTTTIEDQKPDVFLLDGGCLPMTLAGAKYTDELAYGDDKPERCFTTIAEESEAELRKASVLLSANALGIQIMNEAEG